MAYSTIRTKGLKEFVRDCRKIEPQLRKDTQKELSEVAKIVSDDAREWVAKLWVPAAPKIRPRVRGASAFVESRAHSKGIHPEFGSKVMKILLQSAAAKEDEVVKAFEEMLDRLTSSHGFGRGGLL